MADESNDEKPETETPPVAAPAPDPRYDQMQANIAALTDTVRAALSARDVQAPSGGGAPGSITPQLRQMLRSRGLSDADIDHNAPLILPFVEIFAPELVQLVESRSAGLDERLTMKEMTDDPDVYPYAKGLRTEIKKLLADAKKSNQPLSMESAYHTAVSMNQPKCREMDGQRRAESIGADASALGGLGHRTSSNSSARAARAAEPKTAAELATMTREERNKFYESHGDVPVH